MIFENFHWWEIIITIGALLISILVALWSRRLRGNAVANYAFGIKNMSLTNIVLSHIAAGITILITTAIPVESYLFGMQAAVEGLSLICLGCLQAFLFWPVLYKFQFMSIFEYFELRFNSTVRVAISFISTMYELFFCVLITYSTGLFLKQVTGINAIVGRFICIGTCVFYTTLSGYRGIIFSDSIQAIFILINTVVLFISLCIDAGGFHNILKITGQRDSEPIFNFNIDLTKRASVFGGFCRGLFTLCPSFIGSATYQRAISLPTLQKAQIAGVLHSVIFAIADIFSYAGGTILYVIYEGCDPLMSKMITKYDELVPYYVSTKGKDTIAGLMGLFTIGALSASFSTIATFINNTAVVIFKDFVLKFSKRETSDQTSNIIIKLICIIFGIMIAGLTFVLDHTNTVFDILTIGLGMTSGAYFSLLTMGLLFPAVTSTGVLCGCVPMIGITVWLCWANLMGLMMRHTGKPLRADGCSFNLTGPLGNMSIPMSGEEILDMNPVYKIAPTYYGLCSYLFVMVISMIMSYLTGPNKLGDVDKNLLSPFLHKYIPQQMKRQEVPLLEPSAPSMKN